MHLFGQKAVADFVQEVLACNRCIKADEEAFPGTERPTVPGDAVLFYGFFTTMSADELEKLGKDGIVLTCSRLRCLN